MPRLAGTRPGRWRSVILLLLFALALGCARGEAPPRTAEERAAKRYAAAAVMAKDDPVAYFGMGMALQKLGRDEQARAAYARARELAKKP
jgi:Flp pilus assembly protein TadD